MSPPFTGTAPDCEQDCAMAVMFARSAALSSPGVPPGLNERIVCEVPHLAQMPAPHAPLRVRALRLAAPVCVVANPAARRAAAGWRTVGGWAALAAGFAALALMLPTAFPVRQAAHAAHASPAVQVARIRPDVLPFVAAPVATVKLAANHGVRAHDVARPSSGVPDADAVIPVPAAQPAPEQVAFAVPDPAAPSRPVYGPVDTDPQASSRMGAQGGTGTGAAAGFAFTNYDSGSRSGARPH